MLTFIHFCQAYSGAIQAVATVVLIGITSYYAVVTHRSLKVASLQLEAGLLPQVTVNLNGMHSNSLSSGIYFGALVQILNGGSQPFTVSAAAIRHYPDERSITPVASKDLSALKDRVVAGGTETAQPVQITRNELSVDPNEFVHGNWRMDITLQVYNALHTNRYKYIYDVEHGIRRLSD